MYNDKKNPQDDSEGSKFIKDKNINTYIYISLYNNIVHTQHNQPCP